MHRSQTKKPVQPDQTRNLCRSQIGGSVDTAPGRLGLVSPHANDPSDHPADPMADRLPEPAVPAHAIPHRRTSHPESPHRLIPQMRKNHLYPRHPLDHLRGIFRRHPASCRQQLCLQTGFTLRHRSSGTRGIRDRLIRRAGISITFARDHARSSNFSHQGGPPKASSSSS